MIIFGTGTKTLGTKKLSLENCANCGANDLHITCTAKYFHIFWIPTFPTERIARVKCHNCGVEPKFTERKTIDKIKKEKKSFKYPFYLFSGIGAVVLLVLFFYVSDQMRAYKVTENIKELHKSDVIVFKSDEKDFYYFARVSEVRSDTIIYYISNYVYEGGEPTESTYKREKAEVLNFYNTEEEMYFLQSDLDSLMKNDVIYDLYIKKK